MNARAIGVVAMSLGLAGCGLGPFTDSTSEGGGGENLPTAGIGPYGKLEVDRETPADEPYVVADGDADLLAPSILARDDGGYRIWYERRSDDDGGEIWATELPALTELADVAPRPVLAAAEPWEGGDLREPSVARVDESTLVLVYEAGEPAAIGRAVSTDNGASFVRDTDPILEGARAPSIAVFEGVSYLFYQRSDRRNLFVSIDADPSDGVSFSLSATPILAVSPDPEAFDRSQIVAPAALVRETATGRLRFDLFYQGKTDQRVDGETESAIGHAGGFSLDALARPFPVGEAILLATSPFESSPSVLIEPARGVLLFSERRGARARIGAATSP